MKKILFYIDSLRAGGAQRVMSNLVTYFAEKGYQVVLVNDYIDKEPELVRYSVPETVERVYLRENLEGNKYLKNLERIIALRKIIKREHPDTILSFLGRPNKRMLLSTIGIHSRKIVSVRNDPEKEYGNSVYKKLLTNCIFTLADGIVFQTADAKEYFSKRNQKKSTIILNPVADQFFLANWEGGKKQIVTFGRLEKQKNQRLLIEAFSHISDQLSDYKLVIYGEGPLRKDLELQVSNLGLETKVQLPGNVDCVSEILSQSALFVLSSDYEGLPNALMEAMTVGMPCISTDCPCGGPKILAEENAVLLVPTCNSHELATSILNMIQNDELSNQYGKAAKRRARDFRPGLVYKKWEDFLLNC